MSDVECQCKHRKADHLRGRNGCGVENCNCNLYDPAYPSHRIRLKRIAFIPLFVVAWLLHGLSEWCYDAAAWLYKRCGTDIFQASSDWKE